MVMLGPKVVLALSGRRMLSKESRTLYDKLIDAKTKIDAESPE
jgi:hypothetical protein